MAKRFNIIRNIKEEIKKGNAYVAPNGNFVSADLLNNEILAQFKRDLTADPVKTAAIPFEQYKANALAGYTTAAEVLDGICEAFHLVNDDPSTAEVAEGDDTGDAMPDPESEPSEALPNNSEPEKPKRGKAKAGEAK